MKKGFTLVELLATIVILGILTIIVLPDIIDVFQNSSNKTMQAQENQLYDAANLYFTDYCSSNSINNDGLETTDPWELSYGDGLGSCKIIPESRNDYYNHGSGYSESEDGYSFFVCAQTLRKKGYISDIYFDKDNLCDGYVQYKYDSKTNTIKPVKSYLACGARGNKYFTEGAGDYGIKYCGTDEVYYSSGRAYDDLFTNSYYSGYGCYNCR